MSGRWTWVILHSIAAAAFFFSLQRWFMQQSLETSLAWAAAGALAAAALAWSQTKR